MAARYLNDGASDTELVENLMERVKQAKTSRMRNMVSDPLGLGYTLGLVFNRVQAEGLANHETLRPVVRAVQSMEEFSFDVPGTIEKNLCDALLKEYPDPEFPKNPFMNLEKA